MVVFNFIREQIKPVSWIQLFSLPVHMNANICVIKLLNTY